MSDTVNPGLKRTLARSFCGAFLDLDAPDWRDVDLADVARALSLTARWNGHTRRRVSVLEHSRVVGKLVPARHRLAARLHDGHEYMTGDGTRPFAATLALELSRALGPAAEGVFAAALDRIKYRLDVAICRKLIDAAGVRVGDADLEARQLADEMRCAIVKAADEQAAKLEERAFWGGREAQDSAPGDAPWAAQGASPALYPADEPEPGDLVAAWLDEVIRDCRLRFEPFGADPLGLVAVTPVARMALDPPNWLTGEKKLLELEEHRAAQKALQDSLDAGAAVTRAVRSAANANEGEDGS